MGQGLWLELHPANPVQVVTSPRQDFPSAPVDIDLKPDALLADEVAERVSLELGALQNELWQCRTRSAELAAELSLERCCVVELRCEASSTSSRFAALECDFVCILEAKKACEFDLLQSSHE